METSAKPFPCFQPNAGVDRSHSSGPKPEAAPSTACETLSIPASSLPSRQSGVARDTLEVRRERSCGFN